MCKNRIFCVSENLPITSFLAVGVGWRNVTCRLYCIVLYEVKSITFYDMGSKSPLKTTFLVFKNRTSPAGVIHHALQQNNTVVTKCLPKDLDRDWAKNKFSFYANGNVKILDGPISSQNRWNSLKNLYRKFPTRKNNNNVMHVHENLVSWSTVSIRHSFYHISVSFYEHDRDSWNLSYPSLQILVTCRYDVTFVLKQILLQLQHTPLSLSHITYRELFSWSAAVWLLQSSLCFLIGTMLLFRFCNFLKCAQCEWRGKE